MAAVFSVHQTRTRTLDISVIEYKAQTFVHDTDWTGHEKMFVCVDREGWKEWAVILM